MAFSSGRRLALVAAVALPIGAALAADEPAPASGPRLTWLGPGGEVAWTASLGPATADGGAAARELRAPRWYPRLPQLALNDLQDHRWSPAPDYKALLLSFWATWCEPCRVELPRLQRLYESQRERGLEVLAVNVDPSSEAVSGFVSQLGLRLPVARSSPALPDALGLQALPTTILADARGGIRARWSGFRPDLPDEVGRTVRELLAEPDSPGEIVGRVLAGNEPIAVRWSRETPGPVDGVAVLRGPAGGTDVAVLSGRDLTTYDAAGTATRLAPAWGAGRLRWGDLDGDGKSELLSFRPGATRVVILDLAGHPHGRFEAPDPLADLQVLPAAGARERGRILLSSEGRLRWMTGDFAPIGDAVRVGPIADLAIAGSGPAARVAILDRQGRLSWLDRDLRVTGPAEPIPPGARLVVPFATGGLAADGVGLVPAAWAGAAVWARGPGSAVHLWVAGPGEMAIFDAASGREVARVAWPGVAALAAGDFDGDGADEIAVGSGSRVTLLGSPPGPSAAR